MVEDEIRVRVSQEIARPLDVVRRHFLDMEHHQRHPVHAGAEFEVIEQTPTRCDYSQKTKLGPFSLRERSRLELVDGDVVNRCLEGANSGMVNTFSFRELDGSKTEVTVDVRLPRTGGRRLFASLLEGLLRRGFARALEEDRVDLEEVHLNREKLAQQFEVELCRSGQVAVGSAGTSRSRWQTVRGVVECRCSQYAFRMQKARVTVTVRRAVLAKVERQVKKGRAKSVSAWVDAAMEEKARREDLAALLAEMRAESGPSTAKDETWARAVLGL